MSDYNRLIDLTLIRLEEHFEKIGELSQGLIRSDPGSDFSDGYEQALLELDRTMFFMNEAPIISSEHEFGYLYACLVMLGIDTTGLERS